MPYDRITVLLIISLIQCGSYRLMDPSKENVIEQFLVESTNYTNFTDDGPSISFLELCKKGQLTEPFPQYLCPLVFILSKEQHEGYTRLYNETWEAVSQINDRLNHPCSHPSESCITIILPSNRIILGCFNSTTNALEAIESIEDFRYDFIVPHNLPTHGVCDIDQNIVSICSLQSIIIESEVLIEKKSCCCQSGHCARVIIDQADIVSPFIEFTVDVKDLVFPGRKKRDNGISNTTEGKHTNMPLTHKKLQADTVNRPLISPILICLLVIFGFMLGVFAIERHRNDPAAELRALGIDEFTVECVVAECKASRAKPRGVSTPNINGQGNKKKLRH